MAIEVRIPKEITEYREKIVFGMSIRKLVCLGIAIALCVGTYLLLTMVLSVSADAAGYVVILEAIPLMALGFLEKDGMPFEKYFALWLRSTIGNNKLCYQTELIIDHIPPPAPDAKKTLERKSRDVKSNGHPPKRKKTAERECQIFTIAKKDRAAKRKTVRRAIKEARKEYKSAKRRIKEKNKA